MIDMLADPVGAQHKATGTKRTLMQSLYRLRVVGGFGQDGQREIVHRGTLLEMDHESVKSSRAETGPDRPAASFPGAPASPCRAPGRRRSKAWPEPSIPSTGRRSAGGERRPVPDR